MNNTKNQRKNVFKKIFKFFETILIVLVILVCLIIITQRVSNNEKSFFGYRLFKVETGSMIPKYNINDVLLVKEIDINKIEIGDDLVYIGANGNYDGMVITHQVINKTENEDEIEFYTKGIANNTEDPVVSSSQILGIVQAKIYTLTFITNILLNIYSLYFLIVLPIIINLFFKEIHSKDRKERYLEKRRQEILEGQEQEKKKSSAGNKNEKNTTARKKRGQITESKTKSSTRKNKNGKA